MKHGGSKPPPIYSKYVNFNNFWWDCLILTYLVCMDSELGATGYINVHVSPTNHHWRHKWRVFTKSRGSAQIYLLQSFEIGAEILNLRTSLKIRFYITIYIKIMMENVQT